MISITVSNCFCHWNVSRNRNLFNFTCPYLSCGFGLGDDWLCRQYFLIRMGRIQVNAPAVLTRSFKSHPTHYHKPWINRNCDWFCHHRIYCAIGAA